MGKKRYGIERQSEREREGEREESDAGWGPVWVCRPRTKLTIFI